MLLSHHCADRYRRLILEHWLVFLHFKKKKKKNCHRSRYVTGEKWVRHDEVRRLGTVLFPNSKSGTACRVNSSTKSHILTVETRAMSQQQASFYHPKPKMPDFAWEHVMIMPAVISNITHCDIIMLSIVLCPSNMR